MTLYRGKILALVGYLAIVVLVAGGLAWVTQVALHLEQSELQLRHSDTVRLALWRLDSRVFPAIAREDSRPLAHYDPLYPPMPALDRRGQPVQTGSVLVPSPLLTAELPAWMPLHFSVDSRAGWRSPQVLDANLAAQLRRGPYAVNLANVTPVRAQMLSELKQRFPAEMLIGTGVQVLELNKQVRQSGELNDRQSAAAPGGIEQVDNAGGGRVGNPSQQIQQEYGKLANQQNSLRNEGRGGNNGTIFNFMPESGVFFAEKGVEWSEKSAMCCVTVNHEEMRPRWLKSPDGDERLMLIRPLEAKSITAVNGVLLDSPKLREVLLNEISDLLPDARLEPAIDGEEGVRMAALPVRLVAASPTLEWSSIQTPMRVGLGLAWVAALLALVVVGLGGWSLLDLSERRFRFVTAVTHELRTPLTTLRLYTDMLTSGLVRDDRQREEYLGTLNTEAERLHRLIGNVLDFARLERQSPKVNRRATPIAELLESLRGDWEKHCRGAGKELVVEPATDGPTTMTTDPDLVRQVLGNLIDNACKYSRDAADPRVWLRARHEGQSLVFTVEDRGPGVRGRDCRSVFRPFVRGSKAPANAGGVGLGLALAVRWAGLLGGQLGLAESESGACFQLRIPI